MCFGNHLPGDALRAGHGVLMTVMVAGCMVVVEVGKVLVDMVRVVENRAGTEETFRHFPTSESYI